MKKTTIDAQTVKTFLAKLGPLPRVVVMGALPGILRKIPFGTQFEVFMTSPAGEEKFIVETTAVDYLKGLV
jgi:hypothetical protein